MRAAVLAFVMLPLVLCAQDAEGFARATRRSNSHALDRWMKRELHRQREGTLVTTPSATYTVHYNTYDSLVLWLRNQPDVIDAAWDKCVIKPASWPGYSTIGLRVRVGGLVRERCYTVQEGRMGAINLFGWRPKVRRSREWLKFLRAGECVGFVAQQHGYCGAAGR